MTNGHSRRALFARLRDGKAQLRLPWAIGEDDFLEACTRCGSCIAVCPTRVVKSGHGGYPVVGFEAAGCSFCGKCAEACRDACFFPVAERTTATAWTLKASVAAGCVETKGIACRMCDDACEARAIRFRPQGGGRSLAEIDTAHCTGCGACVSICPVKAITVTDQRHLEATA